MSDLYDPVADLEYSDYLLTTKLMVLGIDHTDLSAITIDDILDTITAMYPYRSSPQPRAANVLMASMNSALKIDVRRIWYERQLALGAQEA